MVFLFEIFIAFLITYIFIYFERPKLKFLLFGYFFLTISLILQIPFKYIKLLMLDYLPHYKISLIFLSITIIIISELTKYFSLKRFLKTKSFKNGILFGIGWVSLESINYFSLLFYSSFFSIFGINFNYSSFFSESLGFLSFVFFFIINISITVLIIFSIIKKQKLYLFFGIIYAILIEVILNNLLKFERNIFMISMFIYSCYIIFRYRKIT